MKKVNVNQSRLKQNNREKKDLPAIHVTGLEKGRNTFCHEVYIMGPCVVMQSKCGLHINIQVEDDVVIRTVDRYEDKKVCPPEDTL